jgi:hypothetical protein
MHGRKNVKKRHFNVHVNSGYIGDECKRLPKFIYITILNFSTISRYGNMPVQKKMRSVVSGQYFISSP